METLNKFLKYISFDTTSSSNSNTTPSTIGQYKFAEYLTSNLKKLGLEVEYDQDKCYIYGVLKGNIDAPKIGFISHLDTSEAAKGNNIKPNIINNYDCSDIELNKDIMLDTKSYPDLLNHSNKTLITTDGTTLLGADDKAGIVEIISMLEYFKNNNTNHGDIFVALTPDEEIGCGTLNFDYSKFKVDKAYTVDGCAIGEISYENFNAATATIEINGVSAHCGSAKGKMINSALIGIAINNLLPNEIPSNTEGYEGFFHLDSFNGDVSNTKIKYLIRDFDKNNFEVRKNTLKLIIDKLNKKYNNCIKLTIKDTYYNMKEVIKDNMELVDLAINSMKKLNITPLITPIRGGTDGAVLSYNGLPCPNLGTGGHNFHSVYEYITVEDIEKTTDILIEMVKENAKSKTKKL